VTREVRLLATGADRWGEPLTRTQRQKLEALTSLCPLTMFGYRRGRSDTPRLPGVEFVLVSDRIPAPLRQVNFLVQALRIILSRSIRDRCLVVMTQTPWEGCAALLARRIAAGRGREVRVVVEAHGDWIEVVHLLWRSSRILSSVLRGVSRFVLARADAIRVVSRFTGDLVRRYSSAPMAIFPAFIDLETFLAEPPARRGRRHLLYAGVLTRVKGVDTLLDALAILKGNGRAVPLGLAGDGPERRRLRLQAEKLGIDQLVTFYGHLDQARLAGLMREAHALVLPSRSEGLPRVIVEAMACATPVVASNLGGIVELVADGENGWLVPPGDRCALAKALLRLLEDPGAAGAMGKRGRDFVLRTFQPGAWLTHQRRLLELVLGNERASSAWAL
jgi:glycosyltransferase involved in cell wall biosynthesis